MKAIVADVHSFYLYNSKNTRFPKEFRNHKIIWNMREALLALWEGNITELAIPELGTPGYDFPEFVDQLHEIGQIAKKPNFKYYKLNIL
jgi:hypothetical protein